MLKIRLKRTGKRGEPHYRIVVAEAHRSRNSKSVAEIGYYNPRQQPSVFEIDKEAAEMWLKNGAQPTPTVAQFLVKQGLIKEIKKGSTPPQGKKKKKEAAEEKKPQTEQKPKEEAKAEAKKSPEEDTTKK